MQFSLAITSFISALRAFPLPIWRLFLCSQSVFPDVEEHPFPSKIVYGKKTTSATSIFILTVTKCINHARYASPHFCLSTSTGWLAGLLAGWLACWLAGCSAKNVAFTTSLTEHKRDTASYLYIYVYMYVYMYMSICVYTRIWLFFLNIYIYIYIYLYMYRFIYIDSMRML
jgi:hypothetical protein